MLAEARRQVAAIHAENALIEAEIRQRLLEVLPLQAELNNFADLVERESAIKAEMERRRRDEAAILLLVA